jgi:predicted metalloendopeptidase
MRLTHPLLLVPAIVAVVAVTSAQDKPAPHVPGIDVAGMDLSVRPQDDFFRYVNGKWVDNTPIPPDRSSYGTFAMLGERTQLSVREIVEGEAKTAATPGSNSQKVGDLYKSFMDESRIETLGVEPLKEELARINAISSVKDLPAAFARAARVGISLPFSVNVGADQRNSEVYAVPSGQSALVLPDRDYYLRNDERFAAIRKSYSNYNSSL